MPEMALVADISGVCNSGETRPITSKPTKPASTRMKSDSTKGKRLFLLPAASRRPLGCGGLPGWPAGGFAAAGRGGQQQAQQCKEEPAVHGKVLLVGGSRDYGIANGLAAERSLRRSARGLTRQPPRTP